MTLTPDQLAAIKSSTMSGLELPSKHITFDARQIELLLADYERLTRHNQRMAAALAQLSDKENWQVSPGMVGDIGDNYPTVYIWDGGDDIDPQQLAERALVEDN